MSLAQGFRGLWQARYGLETDGTHLHRLSGSDNSDLAVVDHTASATLPGAKGATTDNTNMLQRNSILPGSILRDIPLW